ncbi:hypothetical protein Aconfl_33590 [Algoriphagus confluentis]|uniref:Uncharacterized protein n=1 Tax=Algoriphagus confluentis TaxID=1697556 RepID=A0ABQ6PS03_9BACT|nr:hypothetical protein Aconfl_33590 [Algoriphagus confluentis]
MRLRSRPKPDWCRQSYILLTAPRRSTSPFRGFAKIQESMLEGVPKGYWKDGLTLHQQEAKPLGSNVKSLQNYLSKPSKSFQEASQMANKRHLKEKQTPFLKSLSNQPFESEMIGVSLPNSVFQVP